MCLSGAIAGIGGASQDGDFRHLLDPRGLPQAGYGYTGIVVAALARYNPFARRARRVPARRAPERRLHAAGRRLPVRARRRDAGADPLLRARRRAARPLPAFALAPRAARRAAPSAARRPRVNNSILVVVLALGVALRDAAALRRARRAARGALGRAQPRRRGDDAGRRRDGLLGRAARSAAPGRSCSSLAVLVAALAGAAMALIHAFLVDHAAREPDRLRGSR